jgi:hypothetical protein
MRLINLLKNNMALCQVYKRFRQHLILEQPLLHQDLWHLLGHKSTNTLCILHPLCADRF